MLQAEFAELLWGGKNNVNEHQMTKYIHSFPCARQMTPPGKGKRMVIQVNVANQLLKSAFLTFLQRATLASSATEPQQAVLLLQLCAVSAGMACGWAPCHLGRCPSGSRT